MTRFAALSNEQFYKAWCVSIWKVQERKLRDKWGHYEDHINFQLETYDNYITDIPPDRRHVATALQYASEWNMSPNDVLDMWYGDFVEMVACHKAVTLRRPWFEDESIGDQLFIYERQFGKPVRKPSDAPRRKSQ